MGFLRKIAGVLGFSHDEAHKVNDDDDDEADNHHNQRDMGETRRPTKGFSVPVPVTVERPYTGPVLVPCNPGQGGIQGLRWHAKRQMIDEDGDVADEFLNEVLPETSSSTDKHRPLPRFEVKYSTRPAKVRNQAIDINGKIHHGVEYQGKLQWV